MTLSAGTRLGPYEVVAPIGAGGMGEVYRARDTRLDRSVAIKILPADYDYARSDSKLTNSVIETKLGTRGTARNWNTVTKLLELVQ